METLWYRDDNGGWTTECCGISLNVREAERIWKWEARIKGGTIRSGIESTDGLAKIAAIKAARSSHDQAP